MSPLQAVAAATKVFEYELDVFESSYRLREAKQAVSSRA
jgi:hypothetical protein